jgi:hypothetical protein
MATLPVKALRRLLERDVVEPGSLAKFFSDGLAGTTKDILVHDKEHLLTIAVWQPEGGLAAREDAKWLGLRTRIGALDDTIEGQFTINDAQANLLWERIKDDRFKPKTSLEWSAFLSDYLLATRNTLTDVGPDLLDTSDPVS